MLLSPLVVFKGKGTRLHYTLFNYVDHLARLTEFKEQKNNSLVYGQNMSRGSALLMQNRSQFLRLCTVLRVCANN